MATLTCTGGFNGATLAPAEGLAAALLEADAAPPAEPEAPAEVDDAGPDAEVEVDAAVEVLGRADDGAAELAGAEEAGALTDGLTLADGVAEPPQAASATATRAAGPSERNRMAASLVRFRASLEHYT
ncbi:MAG: hypothetical protein JOZ39_07455 [Chloroflexi bacterium]|nr:hypothetical protein [Chloroflexota bacterium]